MSNLDKEKLFWYGALIVFLCATLVGAVKPMNYEKSSDRDSFFDAPIVRY